MQRLADENGTANAGRIVPAKIGVLHLIAAVLVAAFFACPQVWAQDRPNNVRVVRRFLQQIYPEILNHGYFFGVKLAASFDSNWTEPTDIYGSVTAEMSPWREPLPAITKDGKPTQIKPREVLGFLVLLIRPGDVMLFSAHGEANHWKQTERIRQLADSHPDWTESQAVRALKDAGARFGPAERAEFEKTIPVAALRELLGDISIKSIKFQTFEVEDDGSRHAKLEWEVLAEGTGSPYGYSIMFEPFGGKLVNIFRHGK